MNTFQKVLNQLSKAQKLQEKTELTTQKVELGIIDDLNDVLQQSDTIIKELRDNENIVARNQKLLKDREKDQSKLITNSDKFRKEFERRGYTKAISKYQPIIKKYSKRYGFDWRLIVAQIMQESRFREKAAVMLGQKV